MPERSSSSVDNALHVLLLFQTHRVLRVADVAEELGVARSTAHRLLVALVARGFASQDPVTRAYLPGPTLTQIGLSAVSMSGLREATEPVLEALSEQVGETVSLVVLEGAAARFLSSREGTHIVRVGSRTGQQMPAYTVSGGKALLSRLAEEQVRTLYPEEELPMITSSTIPTRAELLAELEVTRNRGYAINISESEQGVIAVGVAFRYGGSSAAVSIAAPSSRVAADDTAEIAGVMQQALDAEMHIGPSTV